jgi:hypothetical protein
VVLSCVTSHLVTSQPIAAICHAHVCTAAACTSSPGTGESRLLARQLSRELSSLALGVERCARRMFNRWTVARPMAQQAIARALKSTMYTTWPKHAPQILLAQRVQWEHDAVKAQAHD